MPEFFFDEFFRRTAGSRAHAAFCERVYGKNLCQHGMMDMPQLQALIETLGLGPGTRVLELGCGNGMVAETISDTTGAHVTAVDISAVGIAQALERTEGKRSRLAFVQGDMLEAAFPAGSFDAVIAVDSVYFVRDLDRLLRRLREMLASGGQMGIMYSA